VSDGHRVCGYIGQGHTVTETIDGAATGLGDTVDAVTARRIAQAVVDTAVMAYCPQ